MIPIGWIPLTAAAAAPMTMAAPPIIPPMGAANAALKDGSSIG